MIKYMKINQDFVPSTVNEAIDYLYNNLSDEDKKFIKSEDNSACVHFTIGMDIRNDFSLWEENTPISLDFQKRFGLFGHGDDLSGIILDGVWAKVNNKTNDEIDKILNQSADKFKKHWINLGINPVNGCYFRG